MSKSLVAQIDRERQELHTINGKLPTKLWISSDALRRLRKELGAKPTQRVSTIMNLAVVDIGEQSVLAWKML